MTPRDPDDVIRAWFAEGPSRGIGDGLERTLARLAVTTQGAGREIRMPVWVPAAAVLALLLAAVLALGAGFRIVPPTPQDSARPSATDVGGGCRLELPVHGRDAVLFGLGFAPDTDVVLVLDRANGQQLTLDISFSPQLHTDRTGGFFLPFKPFPEDLGTGRITATAGCTTSMPYVVPADDLPTPCPPATAASAPLVDGRGYRAAVAADAPIAWWRFEDAGDVAVDSAGDHDGTYVGAVEHAASTPLSDGRSAYFHHQFPGDAYVELDPIVLAGDFSIEFWIYFCHWAEADPIVGNSDANNASLLLGEGDGELHLYNGANDVVWAGETIVAGAWQHYVVIRAGDALEIHHDGELEGFEYGAGWNEDFVISRIGRNYYDNYLGYLDEVAVYGHALSSERIAEHAHP